MPCLIRWEAHSGEENWIFGKIQSAHFVCARDVQDGSEFVSWQMERDTLDRHAAELRVDDGAQDTLNLVGDAWANGVGEHDLATAELVIGARQFGHALRRHLSLESTAGDTRHGTVHKKGVRIISHLTAVKE